MTRLLGLIDAGDAGGVDGRHGWSLVFDLAAWRSGAVVEQGARRCEMLVTEAALSKWMSRLRPYDIVSLDVAKSTKRCTTVRRILRVGVKDTELARVAKVLQQPVTRKTKSFGTLTLDRRYGSYDGHGRWNGKKVRLTLEGEAALETAERLFAAQARWSKLLGPFIAKALLSLKNETWLEDDERPLTKQQFLARLKLESITVGDEGRFTFWFHDGGLFWGHAIAVAGSLTKGLIDATLAG